MDTRTKILSARELRGRAPAPATVLTSRFDVFRAAQLRELEGLPRPILAIVIDDPAVILPLTARIEMAAALRVIDYVVSADDRESAALVSALRPVRVVHLEDADRRRAVELKQHVQRRQSV